MNINEAAKKLKEALPDRVITGYWVKPEGVIFNTKALVSSPSTPGQYVVTDSGQIYATNPFNSELDLSEMKKFK